MAAIPTVEWNTLSTEYVGVPWSGAADDGTAIDVTALTAQVAFTAKGVKPTEGDWHDAAWHHRPDPEDGTTKPFADVLFGPGVGAVATVDKGETLDMSVRLESNPETPARLVARIKGI